MRHLINKLTGGDMWVADDRVKKYLEAGHKLASDTVKPAKRIPDEEKQMEEITQEKPKRGRRNELRYS